MLQRILSVDLGNSRCKLRWWDVVSERPHVLAAFDLTTRDASLETLRIWLTSLDASARDATVAVSSVADASRTSEIVQALAVRFPNRVLAPPDSNLIVECRPVESVGQDRRFAARGALERVRAACLVVDAGTALTVDAIVASRPGETSTGRFLGGAIAAGPDLVADALHARTARLPRAALVANPPAIGRSTEAALQSGVVIGFRGAARELVARIAAEAQLDAAPVVLTGGARAFLLAPHVFGEHALIEEPDLVHLGLIAAARAHARTS